MVDAHRGPAGTRAAAARAPGSLLDRPGAEAALVALLALLALSLRVAHVVGSRSSPFFDAPQMDALYHVDWARAFALGERFQPPPFFRAPLYPWMLAAVFRLFGEGLLLPRLLQAGLGAASTVFVYLAARRAFGRPVAALAGLLWATHWVGIFFDGELLLETLAVPLYLLGIWLSLGLWDRPTRGRCLAAGLVWGLSVITRPNVLILLPLLALWLLLRGRGLGARALLAPAWLALGVLLPILPISAYNTLAGHDRVLIASQGGVNLWIGNNPRSDGSSAIVPGTREDWWGGYRDAIRQAETAEGRELRPSEVSRHYARRAIAFAREEPRAWLGLMARKLRLFTWNAELGNNEEPRFLFERFSPLAPLSHLGFGVLFPLAWLGLVVTWKGAWARLPLWGFLAAYSFSVVLFFVNARFRLPVQPPLAIYAAAGLVWMARRLRERRWSLLAPAVLSVIALGVWCHAVPAAIRERTRSNGLLMLATAALQRSEWDQARKLLQEAVQISPANSIAQRGLGIAQRELGDPAGAERAFRAALAQRPEDTDSLDLLADLLIAEQRPQEARPFGERLERAAPWSPRGPYVLGRVSFAEQDLAAAAAAFGAALERDPRHFGAAYSLGIASLGLGHTQAALVAFERALDADPPEDERFLIDAYARAIELRSARGEREAALALAQRMLARFPGHPRARELLESL